jgi:hypothetical protein
MSTTFSTGLRAFAGLSLLSAASLATPTQAADLVRIGGGIDGLAQAANPGRQGPDIILLSPEEGGTYLSPIGIEITFEPAQGSTVDLDTLKVTVVSETPLGVFEADITEDIAKYASEDGINAPNAEIPAGNHVVTIQVADSENRMAERHLAITVREESVLERRARE